MVSSCHSLAVFAPTQIGHNSSRSLIKPWSTQFFNRIFAARVPASSASIVEAEPAPVLNYDKVIAKKNLLACPICFEPFNANGETQLSMNSAPRSTFRCCTCRKEYFGNETHLNLTVASGSNEYEESVPASTEIFRHHTHLHQELNEVGELDFNAKIV